MWKDSGMGIPHREEMQGRKKMSAEPRSQSKPRTLPKTAQQIKVPAAQSKDWSSLPRAHVVE